ncbi:MAG: oxaloacetate decarboxylase subunit alpha, partial [Thermoplasmata archaeon]|nr:oxaloacetate decarboxylase subunit alpha [Thermoplasmata archaeon]
MVELHDLTLRDAHQSILATRMRTEDMLPIAEKMDEIGFWSMEVWGGATFDVPIRFLNEDPWERLRKLKVAMPNTKMQMLERAMNIVAYWNFPDDVVKRFIALAKKNGCDVFRIFDALNDLRN